MSTLLPLDEAQRRLLALATPTRIESVNTGAAQGLYLAQDVMAARTQPPADLSAMDGYAIKGDGPWKRIGESRAGAPFNARLAPGECTRISTGAHMPEGADRVLIQENADVKGDTVMLANGETPPEEGRHVRRKGFDFAQGDCVLKPGTQISPAAIALALSAGLSQVPVRCAPTVAILDSGDELVADPLECGPNQIPASNGAMIAAMVTAMGCTVTRLGPVGDDLGALASALGQAEGADILITTGGASVGDHDLMQRALMDWGAKIDFWKVAIKPGKPLMVATREGQVILGLPGNPVSSYVTAFLFALPLIRSVMGASDPLPLVESRIAGVNFPPTGPRGEFLRGVSDGQMASPVKSQNSSALHALAQADCLIIRPPQSGSVAKGDSVSVCNLRNI